MDIVNINEVENVSPFLKWAGGKRWLAKTHSSLLPKHFNDYYEPFLGGGAIYFSLKPKIAVLADINKELIDCYLAVQSDWQEVLSILEDHHQKHSDEHYYSIRSLSPVNLKEKAARFIYLNRTCWNALYRVNQKGQFNVPKGNKKNVLLAKDDFEGVANLIENVTFMHADFEKTIELAKPKDFIFVDPPYTIKHNFNGFVKYNENMFHWHDQVRLSECLISASNRGVIILLTNANHPSVVELYENDFELNPLSRKSVIAASSDNRGIYEELVIRNY